MVFEWFIERKKKVRKTKKLIPVQNKKKIIMGDFNINLLNRDSHSKSNDFLLMLNSHLLLPYILQPARITTERYTTFLYIFYKYLFHELY